MKHKLTVTAIAFAAAAVMGFSLVTVSAAAPASVPGAGRLTADFSEEAQLERFDFYHEASGDTAFRLRDGRLYSSGRGENKAILKGHAALREYELAADFGSTVASDPSLDCGLYVFAAHAKETVNGIDAYEFNLERTLGMNGLYLKVHRFRQDYLGCVAQVWLPVNDAVVRLKLAVKGGRVEAYVGGRKRPALALSLGDAVEGSVGFRSFRIGSTVDNFSLTAPGLAVDRSVLEEMLARAEKIDGSVYTSESAERLSDALSAAESAVTQDETDEAARELGRALGRLTKAYTAEQLDSLILRAQELDGARYTKNSYGSVCLCKTRAEAVRRSDAQAVSEIAGKLESALEALIAYPEEI